MSRFFFLLLNFGPLMPDLSRETVFEALDDFDVSESFFQFVDLSIKILPFLGVRLGVSLPTSKDPDDAGCQHAECHCGEHRGK